MNPVTFQRAVPADMSEIRRLWQAASERLAGMGIDQWQYPLDEKSMMRAIRRGDCWLVVESDGSVAGTVIVDKFADPEFWTPEDNPASAVYVHRMIVDPRCAGRGIGAAMLEFAARRAKQQGVDWVRLDAWRTNRSLHAYYEGLGFHLVRIVDLPHRRSGALFQRRAT